MNFKPVEDCDCSPIRKKPTVEDIKFVRVTFVIPFDKNESCSSIKNSLIYNFGIPVSQDTISIAESEVTLKDLRDYGNPDLLIDFEDCSFDQFDYDVRDIIKHTVEASKTPKPPKPTKKTKKKVDK